MNPTQGFFQASYNFEPFKLCQNNVSLKSNTQLFRKKEKYAIDCPLCKNKVMPFRIDFNSVVFVCVNQECCFPFTDNLKEFQCSRKELKKKSTQIKEKLYKNKTNNDKNVKLEESKTTLTEDSFSLN